jgi:hypothetical protein
MEENENVVTTTATDIPAVEKTFTQKELDDVVKTRLAKSEKAIYSKLGINGKEDLDGLLAKLTDYDTIKTSNSELLEKVTRLEGEKSKSQYMRIIEKADVDEEVMDLVYTKVAPTKDEKLEDYSNRVQEYLNSHPNFIKGNTSVISTSVDLTGKTTNLGDTNKRMNDFIRRKE